MSIIKLCTRQRRKECFYAIETQINDESTNFFDTFLIPNWRVSYIIISTFRRTFIIDIKPNINENLSFLILFKLCLSCVYLCFTQP